MTKGKYAVRADNRRQAEAEAEIRRLRTELEGERERHHDQAEALKGEIRALSSEMRQRAAVIANKEVARRQAELEQALKDEGLSRDLVEALSWQKDKLIYNACRYISMTKGKDALDALAMVWTWFTETDFLEFPAGDKVMLFAIGLPPAGWVARQLRAIDPYARKRVNAKRRASGQPWAYNLDYVSEHGGEFELHPEWQNVRRQYRMRYRNVLGLEEEDGSVTEIR